MPRTTSAAVIDILGSNFGTLPDGSTPSLTGYIVMASSLINKVIACAARKGIIIVDNGADSDAEILERWMSAHYYTQMDPLYKSRSNSGGSGSFAEQSYKDVAVDLDISGCLNSILTRKRAGVQWLGKTTGEALTWDERNL